MRSERRWVVLSVLVIGSVLLSALAAGTFVAYYAGGSGDAAPVVLAVALLPGSFRITGPYAEAVYTALGLPLNSAISNASLVGSPSVRVAWHVDRLTLVMPNGSEVTIESRAQVIRARADGTTITVTPNCIGPGYEIEVLTSSHP